MNRIRIMSKRKLMATAFGLLLALYVPAESNAAPATTVELPAQPAGESMVPENFLRRWDPVTLFFNEDIGPAAGGAEDNAARYVTVKPAHPGAYTWLNARTLQFRPAEPWPPLTRFRWHFSGKDRDLATLFSPPRETLPTNGASGLKPVESVTLTFPEQVDVGALAQMLTIELRPYPGIDTAGSRVLDQSDYDIKVLERSNRSDVARYVVNFHQPIPEGTKVSVRMRLSLDDTLQQAFQEIHFSTVTPFAVTKAGCGRNHVPLTRGGARYEREQAIACDGKRRAVDVIFSARPQAIDPVAGRNLVRFTPAVSNLTFANAGASLVINGDFKDDTLYQVNVEPAALQDEQGRPLQMQAGSELFLHFPKQPDFVRWNVAQGIVERLGQQMVPMEGRGFQRLDLRIHRIDALNRSLWPFPDQPVVIDESQQPPGPGEKPQPWTDSNSRISYSGLQAQLKSLGSPSVSTLLDLPLKQGGRSARFGLDLRPQLQRISGRDAPGTYLVGIRALDKGSERAWVRVQVTDLALSTVDESDRVRFVVTSLQTGKPIAGARVDVEGSRRNQWLTLNSGTTDNDGALVWDAPGNSNDYAYVQRIVVRYGEDMLVLDPSRPPQTFENGHWSADGDTWLQWMMGNTQARQPDATRVCHTFTDRPVYKPEDAVHIKGFVRNARAGDILAETGSGTLVVNGPGEKEWRYPLALSGNGSFYQQFAENDLPTGEYTAHFENNSGDCAPVTFRKETYRLPQFEVALSGPDITGSDRPFKVLMQARYYAGGLVGGRPVRWRVTQFPYNWTPEKRAGYLYSSDARFSGEGTFQSSPVLNQTVTSDKQGMATLDLDPSIEPTAQPRRYVIESTVTGADDQTVTNTREVKVLPAFVLGVKQARYLPLANNIQPEIIAVGPDGKLLEGRTVDVRLLQRQWHSHLQASDFTQGDARYVTDVIDKEIFHHSYTTGSAPLIPKLPITDAGVYVVEISSQDRLGRSQVLRIDLFAAGSQAVTWSRPPAHVFSVATDKKEYAVGETARMIIESPFQDARALAVVEEPDGHNRYQWVNVRGGSGVFELPIKGNYMPRLPVHFLLLRGRVGDSAATPADALDLGKPSTLATTQWVEVLPREHQVVADLTYPHQARPGDEITLTINLHDYRKQPLAGEVTLWLVDQAVLALGKEQRLDPLPDFIVDRGTRVSLRDTRNLAFGRLPYQEMPGGDGGAKQRSSLLDNVTLRKDFRPVPYYEPAIQIDASGEATIKIKLPDNLTNFKVRAKVASGNDRFGFASGIIAVRLPVIVQPSLPRFVRPGDRFTATAIGRIVEGDGGDGKASIRVDGLQLKGTTDQAFTWKGDDPKRIEYDVTVPTPVYGSDGKPTRGSVGVTLAVERTADAARDAFSVQLPLLPDRQPVVTRVFKTLQPGESLALPAITEAVRDGTLQRSLQLSDQPALLRMAAGLSYLMQYPFGCTEQRISQARAMLASKQLDSLLQQKSDDDERTRVVNQTLQWIGGATSEDGRIGFWPGSDGYVWLTALSVEFIIDARNAGFHIDERLLERTTDALKASLRSDYAHFIDGADYAERVWALSALATAGKLDSAYAAELARRSNYLNLESTAQLTRVLATLDNPEPKTLAALNAKLWGGIVTRLYNGNEIYGGLQKTALATTQMILPSETRTMSEVLRAVVVSEKGNAAHKQLLIDALTTLGQDDGWGSTNANASALLALAQFFTLGAGSTTQPISLTLGGKAESRDVGGATPLINISDAGAGNVQIAAGGSDTRPLVVSAVTRYIPAAPGSEVTALAQGFVVSQELLRIDNDDKVPPTHVKFEKAGESHQFHVGEVIEQHVTLVNPEDRHYVAVVVPLAAGMEPLNPALATAPPEAKPIGTLTLAPAYVSYLDDQMAYFYDTLPKGTYDFYFRTRATIPGEYTEPAAYAQMMYQDAINGNSPAARLVIVPAQAQ